MKYRYLFILFLVVVSCSTTRGLTTFAVSYGQLNPSAIRNFDFVIAEPDQYSREQVQSLYHKHQKLLGYISLGEVNSNRSYYDTLKRRGFVGTNRNWAASFLNLADSVTRRVLENRADQIIAKGFDGLFLDTVDDVESGTGHGNLQPYMVDVIREIRREHPSIDIIQNNGLFLLNKTAPYINGVLVEDVASDYNFRTRSYHVKKHNDFEERVSELRAISKKYHKPIYIVDYAVTSAMRNQLSTMLKTTGFPYYIAPISLDTIPLNETKE